MFSKPISCLFRSILFLLLASSTLSSFAQTLRGKVFDAGTGEPMAGATVRLEDPRYAAVVNLDGSYTIRNVRPGRHEVAVSQIGYKHSKNLEVLVTEKGVVAAPDILLEVDARELTQIVVTDLGGSSDHQVRNLEKNSDVVQNILSEKTIQLLPDVTVANALQRVSGVSIQRDNTGEGRYAIIRGMDQRYNTTLVNGIKIPSPDDKYRFVPMDIFPSEMLERLEVIKALTPNMEGDAIGGTMNLIMKNAPDRFLFTANVSGGYSTIFSTRLFTAFNHGGINKRSPAEINGNAYAANPVSDFPLGNLDFTNKANPINSTMGFTVGDRFLNKKLGVILSASYQNFYKGTISERLVPDAQPLPSPSPNTLNPSDAYIRQYNTQTTRIGLQNKIDYVFNDRNTISLFNLYLHQNAFETRYTPDSVVGLNSSATQSTVSPEYRSRWQIQNIYNATLHGDHVLSDRVKIDWSAVYSIAKQQIPDMATYTFDEQVQSQNGKVIQADSTIPVGTANVMTRTWQHNSDKDLAGYANLIYKPTLFNRTIELETGGLYRYKTRDNYYNSYNLQSSAPSGTPFTSIADVPLYFQTAGQATGAINAATANTYTAHEKVAAGFLQAKFMLLSKLQLLTGVRVENTQVDYTTALPLTSTVGAFGTIHYTDVLPGVHLKYLLTDKQNVRLSYFKSISRPGFGDIVPTNDPSDEQFTRLGNPYLKHVRADNFDMRYELFPGHADQLLIGAFYKQLQNPIEYFVTNLNGPSSLYIEPQNTNRATNFGFEAVFTRYFGMFGVSANYTYTHSQITTNKLVYHFVQGSGNQTDLTTQTRPLQGQANHIGNISLLFKDPRLGLDIQLAFAYTGDRIAQVSPYYNLDIWQKPFSQLDLSLEKTIARRFSFYAKINNLTNAPNKEYIKFPYSSVNKNFSGGYSIPFQDAGSNYTVAQRDIYKLSFLGGFRYKF
jgi:outer membrane receptor protein involved in Fe transport